MKHLLFIFFLYTPEKLLNICLSIAAYLRSILRVLQNYRIDVVRYTGYYNGKPITIGYIGSGEMKDYILNILYKNQCEVTKLNDELFFNLQKRIENLSKSFDMLFVERYSILPSLPDFKRILPNVNTHIKVSDLKSLDSIKITRERRYRLKLIANNGVQFRDFKISEHLEKLKYFYDKLYAPHIAATHGKENVESFDWLKIFYAKGFLRLAYIDNTIISGSLFIQRNDTLIHCKYGVLDPLNKIHRAAGSIHSHLQYAEENNIRFYSGFHAKPFFSDGVFHYKRTSGLGVKRETRNYYFDKYLYMNVLRYSSGVIDFLTDNPFIYEHNRTLNAHLLIKEEATDLAEKIIELYTRYRTAGIDRYKFYIKRELTSSEKELIYRKSGLAEAKHQLTFLTYY